MRCHATDWLRVSSVDASLLVTSYLVPTAISTRRAWHDNYLATLPSRQWRRDRELSYCNDWSAVYRPEDFGTTFSGWSFLTWTKPIPERAKKEVARKGEREYVKHPTALP